MYPNNRTVSLLFVLVAMLFSSSINASSQNISSTIKPNAQADRSVAQLLAQQTQIYAAYTRLLAMGGQKTKSKKLTDSKPGLIDTWVTLNKLSVSNYSKRLKVTATAYTSHADQTDSTPNIAAWGDRLEPGMKVIAVSRDLLNVYGLKHKQKVRIKGLEGEYLVLDKMNKRWRKKIDIYMGMDKKEAFRWGRREVEIHWDS